MTARPASGCLIRRRLVAITMGLLAALPSVQRTALSQIIPPDQLPSETIVSGESLSKPTKNTPGQILTRRQMVTSLPPAGEKIRGFTVDIVADGSGAAGYLPVHLHLKSTSTFSADRNFVIRFEPVELGQSPPQNGIMCDIAISATQGAKEVMQLRHLPKWSVGTAFRIRVFEDGVEFEDYAREIGTLLQRSTRPPMELLQSELTLDWLHIIEADDTSAIDLSHLKSATKRFNDTASVDNSARGRFSQWNQPPSTAPIATVQPESLSSDWRQLQSFDGVLATLDCLETLSRQYPLQLQALRDWLMAGGTLVVINAQRDKPTLATINFQSHPEHLEVDAVRNLTDGVLATRKETSQALIAKRKDLEAVAGGASSNARGFAQMSQLDAQRRLQQLNSEIGRLSETPELGKRIWSQSVAAGRIIGITGDENISPLIGEMVVEFFRYRKSPTLRRGVDPILGDQRVHRWLIPGVAQPPVYTFMGLLAVFVILVGPVAYRKTTHVGRGYLMFAIAPVLALMTTVAMFAYGIVADGFGTTTRIRQLTWVDGKSGDGFDRIRSTYFAGVRPTEGLRFGPRAEVMRYPDHGSVSWEELNDKSFAMFGKVDVRKDAQIFNSSFLPSRAQRQFIVHQPRHQLGSLTLNPPASENPAASPRLDNGFDFQLRDVVVRDKRGKYWFTDKIGPSQTGVLCQPLELNSASKALGDLYNRNRPLAAIHQSRRYRSYDRSMRDLVLALNRIVSDSDQVLTEGIFETWLQRHLQVDGELPRQSFVAEADVSQDLIAVKGAELVESVRYVFGTLP